MSRKIIGNRKFLEEQVRNFNSLEEQSPEPYTTKLPGGLGDTHSSQFAEPYKAGEPSSERIDDESKSEQSNPMSDEMYELIMTVFFGLKSNRESILQLFGDFYDYGIGHKLSNIHKALDQVDNLTPFEAFVFRFLEIDLKPMAIEPTSNMKWKNEIFQAIEAIVKRYASKIYSFYRRGQLNDEQIRKDYNEFINKAYNNIFKKYKLSDDMGPENRAAAALDLFFGPNKVKTKVTRKPTKDYIDNGADRLIRALKNRSIPSDDGTGLDYEISRSQVEAFLEKQLAHISQPMFNGNMNPTGKSIDSFEDMRNATKNIKSKLAVNPDRLLAAIAIREQSSANKRFSNLAVAFADVTLSIVGTVSLVYGAPGLVMWFRNQGLRGLGFFGHKGAKEFLKIVKKTHKKATPNSFILGFSEFFAGLSVAFLTNIRNVENRLDRVHGFHNQYFSLLSQYIETPDAKSYGYLKSDVDSLPYTKKELGKVYDSFKSLVSPSGEDKEQQLGPVSQDPKDMQVVAQGDLLKTLDNILGSPKMATMDSDIESQVQDIDSLSPTTGSSIMQSWRDIYTLIIELQMSAAIYSVKPGEDRERIRSRILNSADQEIQKEYEIFMSNMQDLYKKATRQAIQDGLDIVKASEQDKNEAQEKARENLEENRKKIEEKLTRFNELVAMFRRQEKELEKETKKTKPLLQKMRKTAMPYEIKKKKTNESILKEQEKDKPNEKGEKKDELVTDEEIEQANQKAFDKDPAGHTITKAKPPKGSGKKNLKKQWVKLSHSDFNKGLVVTKKTALAFVQLRKTWASKGLDKKYAPLIPSSTFREKSETSLGNHENGIAFDLVTPKQTTPDGKLRKGWFLHHLISHAWNAGFSGFGIPQKTPCDNGERCHTHIDTRPWNERAFWMYGENGNLVQGSDRWIYKNAEPWFARNVLTNPKHNFSKVLIPELGLSARHKKAIAEFKKKESLTDSIERQTKKKLKELGYNLEDGLEKLSVMITDQLIKRARDMIFRSDKELEKWSKETINKLGEKGSEAAKYLEKQVLKGKFTTIDAIADKQFHQKNFKKDSQEISEIDNIEDLARVYTSQFGLARPNVTGRLSVVRKFAKDLNVGDLSQFYNNKNKEFNYNILGRLKRKKRFDPDLKESTIHEQEAAEPAAPSPPKSNPNSITGNMREVDFVETFKMGDKYYQALKLSFDSKDYVANFSDGQMNLYSAQGGEVLGIGIKGASDEELDIYEAGRMLKTNSRYIEYITFQRTTDDQVDIFIKLKEAKAKDLFKNTKLLDDGKNSLLILLPSDQDFDKLLGKDSVSSKSVKTAAPPEDTETKNVANAEEFKLDVVLNFPLKKNKKIVPEDALKSGGATIPENRYTRDLIKAIKKEINNYFSNEYKKATSFGARYDETEAFNLFLTRGDEPPGSINFIIKLIVTADRNFVKQMKQLDFDLNTKSAQEEFSKIFSDSFSSFDSAPALEKSQFVKGLKTSFFKPFVVFSPDAEVDDITGDKMRDVLFDITKRFSNVSAKVSKTKFDFSKVKVDTALTPGSEDIKDRYSVSNFNKRKRIVEYIPTDFLKFSSDKSVYTVTFDLPGNGFEEFLEVNPTVVRGREPFDKSAPGEKEADRRVLVIMLKRNRQIFVNFLNKLEEIANFINQDGERSKINFGIYSMSDYRIYKKYFESYIKLFDAGIAAIENVGDQNFDSIVRKSYNLNLLVAAIYNL